MVVKNPSKDLMVRPRQNPEQAGDSNVDLVDQRKCGSL